MLFSDTTFWAAEPRKYYIETVRENGAVVEQWAYQEGTTEEAAARGSIDSFSDRELYTVLKEPIDEETYKLARGKIINHGFVLRMAS